jgi:hypothetical protein
VRTAASGVPGAYVGGAGHRTIAAPGASGDSLFQECKSQPRMQSCCLVPGGIGCPEWGSPRRQPRTVGAPMCIARRGHHAPCVLQLALMSRE